MPVFGPRRPKNGFLYSQPLLLAPLMRAGSSSSSTDAPLWPSHWSIGLCLVVGLGLGFLAQSTFHGDIHAYAKAAGLSKLVVHLGLLFGPLILCLPFVYLIRTQARKFQALTALGIGFWLGGFAGLALDAIMWFIAR